MIDWSFQRQESAVIALRESLSADRIDLILRPFGLRCRSFLPLPGGVINLVYRIETDRGGPLVLRVTNPHPLMVGHKTLSEATVLQHCAAHSDLPLPDVLAFACEPTSSPLGCEYILMRAVPGVALSTIWDSLRLDQRRKIGAQLVAVVATLQKLSLPRRGWIGGFRAGMTPGVLRGDHPPVGPFDSFTARMIGEVRWAIESLRRHVPLLGIAAAELADMLDVFAARWVQPLPSPQPVLCHNDLHHGNIVIDPDRMVITGILDWEAASMDVPDGDWEALSSWPVDLGAALRRAGLAEPPGRRARGRIVDVVNAAVWSTFFYSTWYANDGTTQEQRFQVYIEDMKQNIQTCFQHLRAFLG